jgi:rubrerythrin
MPTEGAAMHDALENVVQFAIEQEIKAAELYEKYAARIQDRGARKMLEEMALMERGHEKKLKMFLSSGKDLYSIKGVVPDIHISDFLVEKPLHDESSIQDVFIVAMKAEGNACALYSRFAAMALHEEHTALFLQLAEEEKKHKYDLEQEYEREVLREG